MSVNPQPSAATFALEHDARGRLVVCDAEGVRHAGAVPVRAFPVSDPTHWISICDAEGHEILCIDDLTKLPPPLRTILENELARREFIPAIQRIVSATFEEPSQWCVETDRGPVSFRVGSDEDVRRIDPHQASVVDSHGIRYLIPDIRQLDSDSRRFLEHFL